MRARCSYLGCKSHGIWSDDEDGRLYCGAHLIYVAPTSAEVQAEKRRDNADEYRRGAR